LTEPSNSILAGSSHADDGMDEAVNVCCASSASQSEAFQTLIPCLHAAAPNAREPIDCEEKRDPRERPGGRKIRKELDPNARLEKRTLMNVQKWPETDMQAWVSDHVACSSLRLCSRGGTYFDGRHQCRPQGCQQTFGHGSGEELNDEGRYWLFGGTPCGNSLEGTGLDLSPIQTQDFALIEPLMHCIRSGCSA